MVSSLRINEDVNHTDNLLSPLSKHATSVRLGRAISQGLVISLKDNATNIVFYFITRGD